MLLNNWYKKKACYHKEKRNCKFGNIEKYSCIYLSNITFDMIVMDKNDTDSCYRLKSI